MCHKLHLKNITLLFAGSVMVLFSWWLHDPLLFIGGLIALGFSVGRTAPMSRTVSPAPPLRAEPVADPPLPVFPTRSEPATDIGDLVDEMLAQGRYSLLLRPQLIRNLSAPQIEHTRAVLHDAMAIVPAGEVMLNANGEIPDDGRFSDDEVDRNRYARVSVEDFYLDRYLITNRQYYAFVASAGYEQGPLWDPAILGAVLDFVDSSGRPGPRFWSAGRYPHGEEDYPVVGISWYEAAAFARWIGKRLPTDAEWVKAASWPVLVSPGVWQQRTFPWGNTMVRNRANLWGDGPGRTVPIDQYADGQSVGGVHQLVGNVWEWTSGDFGFDDLDGPLLAEPASAAMMKCLRGGAFDTYFDAQATCQFRSGDHPLVRKHNIGFRCALSVCDVAAIDDTQGAVTDIDLEGASAQRQLEEACT
jgi:iron(II)-dependent oxidoreductase